MGERGGETEEEGNKTKASDVGSPDWRGRVWSGRGGLLMLDHRFEGLEGV